MSILLSIIVLLIWLNQVIPIIQVSIQYISKYWRKITVRNMDVFDEYFIEPKHYYWNMYKTFPSIAFIANVDTSAILELIQSEQFGAIKSIYQRNYYDWQAEKLAFTKTLIRLKNNIVIRLGEDWADVYYNEQGLENCEQMIDAFKSLKQPEKETDFEINIISINNNGLDLKTLSIEPTKLDIDLYYNDDFKAIDALIKERLHKEKDKGIVLLHGLPGTGKTTYLRHLIGSLKKKVMFVSPSVATNLMNPEFMDLLIDNPNAVLVIEDAENIIMDRRYNNNSGVSNLLNISDGLLSDCLNVQIICTFNSDITYVDNALLREGRLIAKYAFDKLEVKKANALSQHLQLGKTFYKPMTLAEITNTNTVITETIKTNHVVGFRRSVDLIEN
ncbi:MAG: AAA family ATPase [Chitinophagaceae bacterium]